MYGLTDRFLPCRNFSKSDAVKSAIPLSDIIDGAISAEIAPSIMSESGIADFTASDLEKFLQGKNLSVSPYINDYFEGFSGHSTPDDLETAFRLIHLYFTNPRFDKDAYN